MKFRMEKIEYTLHEKIASEKNLPVAFASAKGGIPFKYANANNLG